MKNTFRLTLGALLGFMAFASTSHAIEASANGGPQAAQAAVTSMNNTVNASLAALQQQISGTLACNSIRKFYAPTDPKKDGNGCVGVGDYQLTMNNTSGVNTTNSSLTATNSNAANVYTGYFQSMTPHGSGLYGYSNGDGYGLIGDAEQAGGVGVRGVGASQGVYGSSVNYTGVLGYSTNQFGVNGQSVNNWGGVFTGPYGVEGVGVGGYGVNGISTNNIGVYGQSTNSWAGEFVGAAGVYGQATTTGNWAGEFVAPNYGVYGSGAIYGVYSNGPLCINGSCISSWAGIPYTYGGDFTYVNSSCFNANSYTGACSCPGGFTTHHNMAASPYGQSNIYTFYSCYN